jgi:methylation protein EvaC
MLKKIKRKCIICKNKNLYEYLNFGKVALAGSFLKNKSQFKEENKFQLSVAICSKCKGSQITKNINENTLFKDYFYSSSKINTLVEHFKEFSKEIIKKYYLKDKTNFLEIGCNDGVLIKNLNKYKFKNLIGIDPAKNITKKLKLKKIRVINDFFNYKKSLKLEKKFGKFNVIVANNVFAHSHKIRNITKGISKILDQNGTFIFEVHNSKNIILNNQFDMIYHEHVLYYTLTSIKNLLDQFDLKIFDIKFVPTHGGSMRIYSTHKSNHKFKTLDKVKKVLRTENYNNLNKLSKYYRFNREVLLLKTKIHNYIKILKDKGLSIAGYGASGRANTVLQFCDISSYIDFMIDDSSYKQGNYTPGTHLKIYSSKVLQKKNKPDIVIIFAWSFAKEIKSKNKIFLQHGGKFLTILPKIKFI